LAGHTGGLGGQGLRAEGGSRHGSDDERLRIKRPDLPMGKKFQKGKGRRGGKSTGLGSPVETGWEKKKCGEKTKLEIKNIDKKQTVLGPTGGVKNWSGRRNSGGHRPAPEQRKISLKRT